MFPKRAGLDSEKFTLNLLDKGVAVAPGTAFGDYREHFRYLLTAPRDEIKAGLDNISEAVGMKTAIIGAGKMGVWFAKFCKEKGDNVILADRKKEKLAKLGMELGVETTSDFKEAVKAADRIIICVSISSFEEVVKKIGPASAMGKWSWISAQSKSTPSKSCIENIKHGLVLGHSPSFWSRQQRRQTQSLHSHPNQLRRREIRRRIQKVAGKRRSPRLRYVAEKT